MCVLHMKWRKELIWKNKLCVEHYFGVYYKEVKAVLVCESL